MDVKTPDVKETSVVAVEEKTDDRWWIKPFLHPPVKFPRKFRALSTKQAAARYDRSFAPEYQAAELFESRVLNMRNAQWVALVVEEWLSTRWFADLRPDEARLPEHKEVIHQIPVCDLGTRSGFVAHALASLGFLRTYVVPGKPGLQTTQKASVLACLRSIYNWLALTEEGGRLAPFKFGRYQPLSMLHGLVVAEQTMAPISRLDLEKIASAVAGTLEFDRAQLAEYQIYMRTHSTRGQAISVTGNENQLYALGVLNEEVLRLSLAILDISTRNKDDPLLPALCYAKQVMTSIARQREELAYRGQWHLDGQTLAAAAGVGIPVHRTPAVDSRPVLRELSRHTATVVFPAFASNDDMTQSGVVFVNSDWKDTVAGFVTELLNLRGMAGEARKETLFVYTLPARRRRFIDEHTPTEFTLNAKLGEGNYDKRETREWMHDHDGTAALEERAGIGRGQTLAKDARDIVRDVLEMSDAQFKAAMPVTWDRQKAKDAERRSYQVSMMTHGPVAFVFYLVGMHGTRGVMDETDPPFATEDRIQRLFERFFNRMKPVYDGSPDMAMLLTDESEGGVVMLQMRWKKFREALFSSPGMTRTPDGRQANRVTTGPTPWSKSKAEFTVFIDEAPDLGEDSKYNEFGVSIPKDFGKKESKASEWKEKYKQIYVKSAPAFQTMVSILYVQHQLMFMKNPIPKEALVVRPVDAAWNTPEVEHDLVLKLLLLTSRLADSGLQRASTKVSIEDAIDPKGSRLPYTYWRSTWKRDKSTGHEDEQKKWEESLDAIARFWEKYFNAKKPDSVTIRANVASDLFRPLKHAAEVADDEPVGMFDDEKWVERITTLEVFLYALYYLVKQAVNVGFSAESIAIVRDFVSKKPKLAPRPKKVGFAFEPGASAKPAAYRSSPQFTPAMYSQMLLSKAKGMSAKRVETVINAIVSNGLRPTFEMALAALSFRNGALLHVLTLQIAERLGHFDTQTDTKWSIIEVNPTLPLSTEGLSPTLVAFVDPIVPNGNIAGIDIAASMGLWTNLGGRFVGRFESANFARNVSNDLAVKYGIPFVHVHLSWGDSRRVQIADVISGSGDSELVKNLRTFGLFVRACLASSASSARPMALTTLLPNRRTDIPLDRDRSKPGVEVEMLEASMLPNQPSRGNDKKPGDFIGFPSILTACVKSINNAINLRPEELDRVKIVSFTVAPSLAAVVFLLNYPLSEKDVLRTVAHEKLFRPSVGKGKKKKKTATAAKKAPEEPETPMFRSDEKTPATVTTTAVIKPPPSPTSTTARSRLQTAQDASTIRLQRHAVPLATTAAAAFM